MVNWNTLMVGLIFFVFGLIGLLVKSTIQKNQKYSLTSTQIVMATYALLLVGTLLVILSFISDQQ
jgi:hypothetical protein